VQRSGFRAQVTDVIMSTFFRDEGPIQVNNSHQRFVRIKQITRRSGPPRLATTHQAGSQEKGRHGSGLGWETGLEGGGKDPDGTMITVGIDQSLPRNCRRKARSCSENGWLFDFWT
jgi:hypothetical protein